MQRRFGGWQEYVLGKKSGMWTGDTLIGSSCMSIVVATAARWLPRQLLLYSLAEIQLDSMWAICLKWSFMRVIELHAICTYCDDVTERECI